MNSVVITIASPAGSQQYAYECHNSTTLTAIVNGTMDTLTNDHHLALIEVF